MQRYREARDHLVRAIPLGWDDADAWVNRGVAEWKLGRLRKAERCMKRALEEDPRSEAARTTLERIRREAHPPAKP
jgi:tetratricopeptide (TPR) repeat protein